MKSHDENMLTKKRYQLLLNGCFTKLTAAFKIHLRADLPISLGTLQPVNAYRMLVQNLHSWAISPGALVHNSASL